MSQWQELGIEERVVAVLRATPVHHEDHHLGPAFLTAYQIAIEFNRLYPEITAKLGLKVGGTGTGEHTSLAQYLARQLSGHIKSGGLSDVEGALLSDMNLKAITFRNQGEVVESSLAGYGMDMSMFRYVGKK